MDIQSIKRWHWMVIGAVAGAGLGWGQLASRQEQRVGGEGFITQEMFERELALPAVDGRARFTDVAVYSVGDVDIVQMRRLVREDGQWVYEPSRFAAPRPYRSSGRPADTVADHIRDVIRSDSRVKVEYAWWRFPSAVMGIWITGAMVAIGGIWPMVLGFLVGAGFGRTPPEKPMLDLDQFKGEPGAAASGPTEADQLRLRELEEAMLLGLTERADGCAGPVAPTEAADTAPAVKQLKVVADEPALPAEAEDPRHYAGEFYPVARAHAGHETDLDADHAERPARGS